MPHHSYTLSTKWQTADVVVLYVKHEAIINLIHHSITFSTNSYPLWAWRLKLKQQL